jgi:methionyl-tRNA formyltransferase
LKGVAAVNEGPLRIIFAGSGAFGLPTLDALLKAGHHVVQIYTQPDRPAGRGKTLTPTLIAQYAIEKNLTLIRTERLNNESLPSADLLIVIAFGQKISQTVANHCRLGAINLHASLLPKYRGAAPINWAIMRGETATGNSVIRLAEHMDAGALLGQSHVAIDKTETAGELHDRLAADGAPLMLRIVEELASGQAKEIPQDDSQATTAPKLSREMAKIDWSQPSRTVAKFICGVSPWPGCRARLIDEHEKEIVKVTLLRARVAEIVNPKSQISNFKSGRLTADGSITTGDGAIEILELQPEGKRPMSLADFKNGKPWREGMSLQSL